MFSQVHMIYVTGKLILGTGEEVNGMDHNLFVVTFNRQHGDSRNTLKILTMIINLNPGIDSESGSMNTHVVCCKTVTPYSYIRIIEANKMHYFSTLF
jgi:hypothetical protein